MSKKNKYRNNHNHNRNNDPDQTIDRRDLELVPEPDVEETPEPDVEETPEPDVEETPEPVAGDGDIKISSSTVLYPGPTASSGIAGRLNANTLVEVVERKGPWAQVIMKSDRNRRGWIYSPPKSS